MTAYAMAGDKERFLAHGMNGYVSKPVDLGRLAGGRRPHAGGEGRRQRRLKAPARTDGRPADACI